MIKNFTIDLANTQFHFHTINAIKLKAFQVYVQHDAKQVRFHMQINNEGTFYITDKDACPTEYHQLERELNDKILISQAS